MITKDGCNCSRLGLSDIGSEFMKLFHLSDLHLGKRVNDFSMIEDQKFILNQILAIADEEKPDAVLIAGDVYDKSVPSAEAVELLDDFLCHLAGRELTVFLISGNHDSPERLAFGGRLLDASGIHLSPVYHGVVNPIKVTDEHGEVNIYMLPFVKPVHVRRFYPEEHIDSYSDALSVAVKKMEVDSTERNILLTHQFVVGAKRCESEELSVGGTDQVDASVFEVFDYVALGHIHGPQNIVANKIRYCGTPLKYSFSEAGHHKSVTVVEMRKKGDVVIRTRELSPRYDMVEARGEFADLITYPNGKILNHLSYLHITLTDEEDVPEAIGRLRAVYPNLMKLSYDNTRTRENKIIGAAEDVKNKSPLQLFEELYVLQNNQPMSDVQRAFLQDLIDSILEERA